MKSSFSFGCSAELYSSSSYSALHVFWQTEINELCGSLLLTPVKPLACRLCFSAFVFKLIELPHGWKPVLFTNVETCNWVETFNINTSRPVGAWPRWLTKGRIADYNCTMWLIHFKISSGGWAVLDECEIFRRWDVIAGRNLQMCCTSARSAASPSIMWGGPFTFTRWNVCVPCICCRSPAAIPEVKLPPTAPPPSSTITIPHPHPPSKEPLL